MDSSPTSATEQVLNTTELLEQILLGLKLKNPGDRHRNFTGHSFEACRSLQTLLHLQRVSKTWYAVIRDSSPLQQALFFTHHSRYSAGEAVPIPNLLIHGKIFYDKRSKLTAFLQWGVVSGETELVLDVHVARGRPCEEAIRMADGGGSWRKMLLASQSTGVVVVAKQYRERDSLNTHDAAHRYTVADLLQEIFSLKSRRRTIGYVWRRLVESRWALG